MIRLLLAAAVAALPGCGSKEVTVRIQGVVPLNMNAAGEDCPIDVRIYVFKDTSRFTAAEFNELWKNDKAVLGDSKIGEATQVTIFPGVEGDKPAEIRLGLLPSDARFIGFMPLYANKEGDNKRRLLIPVEEAGDEVVILNRYTIRLK